MIIGHFQTIVHSRLAFLRFWRAFFSEAVKFPVVALCNESLTFWANKPFTSSRGEFIPNMAFPFFCKNTINNWNDQTNCRKYANIIVVITRSQPMDHKDRYIGSIFQTDNTCPYVFEKCTPFRGSTSQVRQALAQYT